MLSTAGHRGVIGKEDLMVHNCDKYTGKAASEFGLRNARAERDEASRDSLMERVWRFLEQYPLPSLENGIVASSISIEATVQRAAGAEAIYH
jgi:hypothetical protein